MKTKLQILTCSVKCYWLCIRDYSVRVSVLRQPFHLHGSAVELVVHLFREKRASSDFIL